MNVFLVYYHPEPQSFNGAMMQQAVATFSDSDHRIKVSDLHRMAFNPVSGRHNFQTVFDEKFFKQQFEELNATEKNGFAEEIEEEISRIEWCDLMIWQFPLWWFGLPATLKGWVDRVFAMGRIYGNGRSYDNGVFKGKRAMLSLTTGGPQQAYLEDGSNGDIYSILRPIHRGILEFTGFSVLQPHIAFGPAHLPQDEREMLLERYAGRLRNIESESPISIGRYG